MKKILIVVGALVVLAVVGVLVLVGSLGAVIKSAVQKFGSDATGAEVTLADADLSVTSGEGSLKELVIGNPQGFNTDSAFRLGEIGLKLDTASLSSDTIVVKEILIAGPEVTYELGGSGSNIGKIQQNVDAYVKQFTGGGGGKSGGDKTPTADEPAADSGGGKKIVVENLIIREGRINVSATFLGGKKVGTTLPAVHLTDLGKSEGGLSPEELTGEILDAMTSGVTDAVAGLDLGGMADKAKDAVDGAVEGAGKAIKDLFGK